MPRTKQNRNPLGSILEKQILKNGKKIKVFDVRKRVRNSDGVYKDKTKRCYSYSEAMIELANMPATLAADMIRPTDDHSLADLTAFFRREYLKAAVYSGNQKITGYKQSLDTIERYLKEIEGFFGDVALRSIHYEHCRSFRDLLATTATKYGKMPAASTYHKKIAVLGRLFNIAIQLGWLDTSPMKRGVSLIKKRAERVRNRMLTYDEEERLIAACLPHIQTITFERKHKNTGEPEIVSKKFHVDRRVLLPYIYCSLDAAMRRGEIFQLKWRQVDFDRRVILLTEESARDTKTGVEGILPLTDRLAFQFLTVRNLSDRTGPDDLVLGWADFRTAWENACAEAGITGLQFRDLRATGATRMLLSGSAGDIVRKITRHTKPETFLEHYTSIDAQNARSVGDKLQKFNENELRKVKDKGKAKKKASGR